MKETIQATKLYKWTSDSEKPIVVHQGGTSSGKTYAIMQYLLLLACSQPKKVITVVGQDIPNLKAGAYRDSKEIVNNTKVLQQELEFINKSERTITFNNGSIVEFNSYKDEQDAKSGKRTHAFFNEANGIPYGIYENINIRTSEKTIIDFNPSARFWAHEKLFGLETVDWFTSTFRDNRFIKERVKRKILSYEPTKENIEAGTANEYRWKVYGLGEMGKLEGLIFPYAEISEDFPEDYEWSSFGMDFGYTNDPTAVTEVRYSKGQIYIREWLYQKRLKTKEIYQKLKDRGFDFENKVISDIEPRTIDELRDYGMWIDQTKKGDGSVELGLQKMSEYKINVYYKSKNLIEEINSYQWKVDRDGEPTNKPVKKNDHLLDSARYAIMDKLDMVEEEESWVIEL